MATNTHTLPPTVETLPTATPARSRARRGSALTLLLGLFALPPVALAQAPSNAIAGACREGPADSVAVDVLRILIPISIKENREYAGWIYYDSKKKLYCYTAPKPGTEKESEAGPLPAGAVAVGGYHTHGNWRGGEYGDPDYDENFSVDDLIKLDLKRIVGYLGTPNGNMLKFVPCKVESVLGCGPPETPGFVPGFVGKVTPLPR